MVGPVYVLEPENTSVPEPFLITGLTTVAPENVNDASATLPEPLLSPRITWPEPASASLCEPPLMLPFTTSGEVGAALSAHVWLPPSATFELMVSVPEPRAVVMPGFVFVVNPSTLGELVLPPEY